MLKIWKKVEPQFPDWDLHIFGKIDQDQNYINQAKSLHLKQMHFHQPVQNIQKEYLESSIMLLPSRSEGFGMVLIEAMACGVPSIAFDCPSGPRDIISNGEDGFLIENQNSEAFQHALEKLIEDESLRKEMGRNAQQNVKRYAPEIIIEQWDKLFKNLLTK